MDPGPAAGPPALFPGVFDLLPKLRVPPVPLRRRPLQPGVVPAGGETRDAAHRPDGELGPVRLHELEPLPGIEPLSIANQAAAFL